MASDTRPVIANLDFNDIKKDIVRHFQSRSEFQDYNFEGSSLNLLIDILAYNTHYNALSANFLVNEMFLDSALLRKNVVSIAQALNYTPRSARSSKATLTLSIPKLSGSNFYTLPAGSLFSSASGNLSFNFYTIEDYTVQFDNTDVVGTTKTLNVDVYEGTEITQRFIVSPAANDFQRYELLNQNIDTSTLVVTVNGLKYQLVSEETQGINDVTKDSNVYFIDESRELTYYLKFGNGVIGKKPTPGDEILATYLVTSGPEANGVQTFSPNITGRDDITISATVTSRGGANIETINEIKDNAPNYFQTQYRAVTAKDYEAILKRNFADIQAVHAYGGEEVGKPGKVFFSIKPKNRDKLTPQEKLAISRDILTKFNLVTITPEITDPDIIKVIVKTIIQYDPARITTTPEVLVARTISLFNTLNTTYVGDFLESFRVSKISQEIINLDQSIVSANTRANLRIDVNALNQVLDKPSFSFGNRLHEVIYAGEASFGAVCESTEFQRLGRTTFSKFRDDGRGNMQLIDVVQGEVTIVNPEAGKINYETGDVTISDFDPADGDIGFIAYPESFDINASGNSILQISVGDSSARAIDKNDIASLNSFNVSRGK